MPSSSKRELLGIQESVKFYPLFLSMFAVIMIAPLSTLWPIVSALLGTLVMLSGILVVGRHRLILAATLVLAIPAIAIWWLETLGTTHSTALNVLAASLGVAYYIFVALILLISVLQHQTISHNTVIGAICVYLLIAFAFARGYAIVELITPGSIRGLNDLALAGNESELTQDSAILTYFSFVTITTLGYGDLSPATPLTRSMVIIETLVGQLFLIGFVARLVGIVSKGDPQPPA